MHPASTRYRLESSADAAQIAALPGGLVPRKFPTVVAEREGRILGFLGTHDREDCILAGPLGVRDREGRSRAIIAWRLLQAYEVVLAHAGVSAYYFTTDDPHWAGAIVRSGLAQPYAADEELRYFIRRVGLYKVKVH